jgi:hypothetical protein
MRTLVFELHILPLFRATDHEHMRVQVDLWDYDQVVNNADRILRYLKAEDGRPLMPPYGSGGPWPDEWVQLFQRWAYSGFKRLELGSAEYNFDSATNTILATGTFPTSGYAGWLQIVTETDSSRTYVLYFEGPDAAVTGGGEPFSLEEPYEGPETHSIYVRDSKGVHQIR